MSYYIYKICCDDCPDYVYVGSTKAFRERKANHKRNCNTRDTKLYTTIKENGGWDNWRMVLIEECGVITFTQARIKEEEHRVKLNANLNSQKCYTTEEERKEYEKEKHKEWHENNKEHKKEYNKEWYENNKECHKEYREKNEEKIKQYHSQPYTCECGRTFQRHEKSRHEKSKIHKQLMEQKNNSII